MGGLDCPDDPALLAWLHNPQDERFQTLADHLDACASCQERLEKLDASEERRAAAVGGEDVLKDLHRQPPFDEWETEAECASAARRAAALDARSAIARDSRQPDPSALAALTHRGHYEILGVLGHGGMGVVYKARNIKMNRLAAIKVLPSLKSQDPGAVARFEREMKAVAKLTHPHIVTAYDADEADGKHFLVMEYIDGSDLKALVKTQGPLSVANAVNYIVQAARGLHHAHEQGVVHRDIKPANLMLDRSGVVKVLDLGLARIETQGGNQTDLTETGLLMGTADFLAPEQAEGARDVDRRADVYSLGCTLYFLLTGRTLYENEKVIQKVLAHREKPIPSLREACPECPAFLEQVFAKMAAKRPEERYPTMAAVIADLETGLASAEGCTLSADALPKAAALPANQVARRWRHGKRRALVRAAVVLLVCLCAALLPSLINRLRPRDGADAPEAKQTAGGNDGLVPLACGDQAGQEWDGNVLKMKFCWCPPGNFLMSSPEKEAGRTPWENRQVKVVLSRGFWMGKYEVTQDEWEQVMGTKPSRFNGGKRLPVENVTWGEAVTFAAQLSKQELARGGIPAGWEFRLPTDAQWEYACRAGTTTVYSFGPTTEGLRDYMWYGYNSDARTHEVGGKKPNRWGLHDMHGNVWEWCADWFQKELPGGTDPEVKEVGTGRVFRGGGWECSAEFCRTAFRSGQVPDEATHRVGFRVSVVQVSP